MTTYLGLWPDRGYTHEPREPFGTYSLSSMSNGQLERVSAPYADLAVLEWFVREMRITVNGSIDGRTFSDASQAGILAPDHAHTTFHDYFAAGGEMFSVELTNWYISASPYRIRVNLRIGMHTFGMGYSRLYVNEQAGPTRLVVPWLLELQFEEPDPVELTEWVVIGVVAASSAHPDDTVWGAPYTDLVGNALLTTGDPGVIPGIATRGWASSAQVWGQSGDTCDIVIEAIDFRTAPSV